MNMKLENFKPRPMREVEYFGENISIPAGHEWVATATNGSIYSFGYEPYYEWKSWIADEVDPFVIYDVGYCMKISDRNSRNSLRHYPRGDN